MGDLLSWLHDQSILMLTGIFVTFISSFLYTINAQGFVHRGKYRKKEDAIIIFLGSTLILGLLTPVLYALSYLTINYIPVTTIFGIVIFGTNFVLHSSIPSWKHTSTKSLVIYLLGIFLIILGFFIAYYMAENSIV
jgi:cytochrome bd-type quinol oxidase subunit 2